MAIGPINQLASSDEVFDFRPFLSLNRFFALESKTRLRRLWVSCGQWWVTMRNKPFWHLRICTWHASKPRSKHTSQRTVYANHSHPFRGFALNSMGLKSDGCDYAQKLLHEFGVCSYLTLDAYDANANKTVDSTQTIHSVYELCINKQSINI